MRPEIRLCGTRAPADAEAVVVEEDRGLLLSAGIRAEHAAEDHGDLIARAMRAALPEPGSVIVREGKPLVFYAVVYDLDRDPIWREQWVQRALDGVLGEAVARRLRCLYLPMLALKHGNLSRARFMNLLQAAVARAPAGVLETLWVQEPGQDPLADHCLYE